MFILLLKKEKNVGIFFRRFHSWFLRFIVASAREKPKENTNIWQ